MQDYHAGMRLKYVRKMKDPDPRRTQHMDEGATKTSGPRMMQHLEQRMPMHMDGKMKDPLAGMRVKS